MAKLEGKVAIVTGGASGMGKADAIILAEQGAKVMITGPNEEKGWAVADNIGPNAHFLKHDVCEEPQWQQVIETTLEKFGRLDILVNNAGVLALGSVVDTSIEDWERVNRINSTGVFLGCKHAIPAMTRSDGGGSIINISSVSALYGVSFAAAYAASKGAITALTKSVAMFCKEQNNGIRCNSIHPDGVKTPMLFKTFTGATDATQEEIDSMVPPNYPMAAPEEVATMVSYLASDDARFITGAEMRIDNGATITPPTPS